MQHQQRGVVVRGRGGRGRGRGRGGRGGNNSRGGRGEEDDDHSPAEHSDQDARPIANFGREFSEADRARRESRMQILQGALPPSIPRVSRDWVYFPEEYVRTLRMCAVTRNVTCLRRTWNGRGRDEGGGGGSSYDGVDDVFDQTGAELVLVGIGEAIPTHFQWMIWLMEMINRAPSLNGSVVAIPHKTRLAMVKEGKSEKKVIGIEEAFNRSCSASMRGGSGGGDRRCRAGPGGAPPLADEDEPPAPVATLVYSDWPESSEPIHSFAESCHRQFDDPDVEIYVSTEPVRMHLGLIPIEYESMGERVRVVGQVLRVTFAPGFHGLKFIEDSYIARRNSTGPKEAQIRSWCTLWKKVLDYEMGENLRSEGLQSLPDPYEVRTLTGVGSVMHVLSPFLVMEKLLNNLPGCGFCGPVRVIPDGAGIAPGTLRISGFPDVSADPAHLKEYIDHTRRMNLAYLGMMEEWNGRFSEMMEAAADTDNNNNNGGGAESLLPEVIPGGGGRDCVFSTLDMRISMQNSHEQLESGVDKMQKLMLPKLVVAIMGWFLSVSSDPSLVGCTLEQYVSPHVEDDCQAVTRTAIEARYGGIKNVIADIPQAGMSIAVRKTFETSQATLCGTGALTKALVESYRRFLAMSRTITTGMEKMKSFGSLRVFHAARIVDSLARKGLVCRRMREAMLFCSARMPACIARTLEQKILAYDEMVAYYEILASMCVLNESARMNSMNLTTLLAFVVSDVLSFLGTHNRTWIFKQFTNWILGGNGHLRCEGMLYCAKRNSSGLSSVVIHKFNWCLGAMNEVLEAFSIEADGVLKCHKMSRITAPQLENIASVTRVDGKILSMPNEKLLLRPVMLDEFLRTCDQSTLNAAVMRIPRDQEGRFTTHKTCEPEKDKPMRGNAEVDQLDGMGPLFIGLGTNSNPAKPETSEVLKSLLVALHAVLPGATQADFDIVSASAGGGGATRKRKLNEHGGNTNEGVSTEPTDPEVREHLAWTLSVLPTICRRIALLNKTGQINIELTTPCLIFFDWFVSFVSNHMQFVIGSTIFSDFHRLMQGYLSRGVALSLLVTAANHLRREGVEYREACTDIITDMESSAMSMQVLHTALLSGLSRVVDCNLIWMNQIVSNQLPGSKTPVLDLDWLCVALDAGRTAAFNANDHNTIRLRTFLLRLEGIMHGEYAHVKGLVDKRTYGNIEAYMEKYLSVVKGSYSTYRDMITESASKCIDLEVLLGMRIVSLKTLCQRVGGVAHDSDLNPDNDNNPGEAFMWTAVDCRLQLKDAWINVVQHIFLTAMQGEGRLHAENSSVFASRMYAWVLRRFVPAQFVPAGVVIMDSFTHGVIERPQECVVDRSRFGGLDGAMPLMDGCRSDYLLRGVNDSGAIERGEISQSPPFYGPYLPEDTVHMGSMVQLWRIIRNGVVPCPFLPIPDISPRQPELVQTRIYPVKMLTARPADSAEDEDEGDSNSPDRGTIVIRGVVCISPNGMSFVLVMLGEMESLALSCELWALMLRTNRLAIGPLVHRCNAVVRVHKTVSMLVRKRGEPREDGDGVEEEDVYEQADRVVLGVIMERDDDHAFDGVDFSGLTGWNEQEHVRPRVPCTARYFMDARGLYCVAESDEAVSFVHFDDLDLVKTGTHVFVEIDVLRDIVAEDGDGVEIPPSGGDESAPTHVRGWIRYPDECAAPDAPAHDPAKVYVVFQVYALASMPRIFGVPVDACTLEMPEGAPAPLACIGGGV